MMIKATIFESDSKEAIQELQISATLSALQPYRQVLASTTIDLHGIF